eukprot:TRINITY_DN2202_c0_g1_i6.p3 TRINITY_DN2202_c0_g1~~TRINITY_DN2202_c0_g1_i6.p3  ORF type:complete len:157 (+),score=20.17 TRINITY_DN2202_c0_g1_i6:71-541(+)
MATAASVLLPAAYPHAGCPHYCLFAGTAAVAQQAPSPPRKRGGVKAKMRREARQRKAMEPAMIVPVGRPSISTPSSPPLEEPRRFSVAPVSPRQDFFEAPTATPDALSLRSPSCEQTLFSAACTVDGDTDFEDALESVAEYDSIILLGRRPSSLRV